MKRAAAVLVLSLLAYGAASAGGAGEGPRMPAPDGAPGLLETAGGPALFSLFDPARLQVGHTLAFGVATDGKKTVSNSLYLNTLEYRISQPLMLTLRWGVSGMPLTSFAQARQAERPGTGPALVVPEFELRYRPSESFMIRVQYSGMTAPVSAFPYRLSD